MTDVPFPSSTEPAGGTADRETARLADLAHASILDSPPEEQFDRIVDLARELFDSPAAAITLIDKDRQWFKAKSGIEVEQSARENSFCTHTIESDSVFIVPDARLDPRFADNPLVTGKPNIRFYAGAPLRTAQGHNLGAVCIISSDPHAEFSPSDYRRLEILASIVSNEIELRRFAGDATRRAEEKESQLHEAHYRIKNTMDYATLLAEVQSASVSTEQLAIVAMAAWKQYTEAGGILSSSIRKLRARMPAEEYRVLLEKMPGFAM
jgi:GAF domain-containing protein